MDIFVAPSIKYITSACIAEDNVFWSGCFVLCIIYSYMPLRELEIQLRIGPRKHRMQLADMPSGTSMAEPHFIFSSSGMLWTWKIPLFFNVATSFTYAIIIMRSKRETIYKLSRDGTRQNVWPIIYYWMDVVNPLPLGEKERIFAPIGKAQYLEVVPTSSK